MAFADYTFTRSSTHATCTNSTLYVIEGAKSVRVSNADNATDDFLFRLTSNTSAICTEIFCVATSKESAGSTSGYASFGLWSHMQGSVNFAANAYWCVLHADTYGAAAARLVLNKVEYGTAMTDNVGLAHADVQAPARGEFYVIGLRVEHDTVSGNNFLTAFYEVGVTGITSAYQFTSPALATYLDNSSPYATSLGVGIGGNCTGGGGFYTRDVYFDAIQVRTS